ncbi:hypothetical protein FNV43_RR06120 [Rhamnella rubrinervis]|uniref:Thioredoxin domain-containing protein n=1 Tax=Rhamnella rubrinervis TaxID=2594499 RepID=A0A8K0HCV6_9ROSA|nr:hypothetical protein FNV43_RR06120 [Rhamnella rubrinervis]
MARNSVVVVRQVIRHHSKLCVTGHHLLHPLRSTSVQAISPPPSSPITYPSKPISKNFYFSKFPFLQYRSLSSSSDPSNIVLIKSEEGFKSALSRVQDESLPAIFYFTAVWCGPCRAISPILTELSSHYPHVTTYKIDIDEDLGNTLSLLNISSVPTFHFFQNGKKGAEVIGADVAALKNTMEKLYK